MSTFLARHLEDHGNAHFRASLLGSLSNNLMTTSTVAGTFISCAACGTGTSTLGVAVCCEHCGARYELKPDPTYRSPGIRLTSRALQRRKSDWFLADENWSVADLFYHLLRLPADEVLPDLCERAGRPVAAGAALEHVLFWPRLRFGRKTIQPDVVLVFDRHLVLFEFKRPAGADLPRCEIAGQVAFAHAVEQELGHDWTLFIVPGPRTRLRFSAADYARQAHEAQPAALANWGFSEAIAEALVRTGLEVTASHIRVHAWESLLECADLAAATQAGHSWQTRSVRHAIREFHRSRAQAASFQELSLPPL